MNTEPTAAELVREDLSPMLMELLVITDTSNRYTARFKNYWQLELGRAVTDSRNPSGNFMALNYGLLAAIVALIVAVIAWLA